MKRDYELVFVVDGSIPEDQAVKERESLEGFLTTNGAELNPVADWGKRQLAYEINKKKSGYYSFFTFSAEGTIVEKIERNIKLNPKVIRHLLVVADNRPFDLPPEDLIEKIAVEGEDE